MQRKDFLRKTAGLGAGIALAASGKAQTQKSSKGKMKNDEITLAVIGIHGQGRSHLRCFSANAGVRVKTICDVDESLYSDAAKFAGELGIGKINFEHDFRRVLEDKDIDAVSIATPEHWHALMTIWACLGR